MYDCPFHHCWCYGQQRETGFQCKWQCQFDLGDQGQCWHGCHRIFIYLHRHLRFDLGMSFPSLDYMSLLTATGSHCVDLCSRGVPTEVPSQGRRCLGCNQLDLQLCPCILRGTSLPQHPVEDLHHLRSILYSHDVPRVLHVP